MTFRYLLAPVIISMGFSPLPANAARIYLADMQFESGASFSGTLTFSDDLTQLTGVSGALNGYDFSINGPVSGGSDSINWIWEPGYNFADSPSTFGTYLMDGSADYFNNSIALTYGFAGAPSLQLVTSGLGISVNGTDYMVSGNLSPVPLPAALPLFGMGVAGVACVFARKKPERK